MDRIGLKNEYLRDVFRTHFWTIIVCVSLGAMLAIGAAWQISRGSASEIKPNSKLLLILYNLSANGRLPTPEEGELLARGADEALPLLIDAMTSMETSGGDGEDWSWSMEALATIGMPAVPKLIETVERARERAASAELQTSDFAINLSECTIKIRAAMVLGRIGDARALPALLNVQSQDDHCLRYEVDFAIKRIRNMQSVSGN